MKGGLQHACTATGTKMSRAMASDEAFGSDFATRRRQLKAQAEVVRILARAEGRLCVGRILNRTRLPALQVAEALRDLVLAGLVLYLPNPNQASMRLAELMPSVPALEKAMLMVAETGKPLARSRAADARVLECLQRRIEQVQAASEVAA